VNALSASLLSLAILAAGAGGLYLFGQPPEVPQSEEKTDTVPLVRTQTVVAWEQPVMIEMDGEASSFRVVSVGAQVRGQIAIKSPKARSGMFVQEGDVLFEIDDTNYQLNVEQLEAQLDQSRQEMRSVEVNMENSSELIALSEEEWTIQKRHLARIEKLFQGKSTSQSDFDTAKRQELTARNSLQTMKNTLRSQEQMLKEKAASMKLIAAQLKQARTDLQRCTVNSPLSGRIVDDTVEQGDFVNEGGPLVHISDSSKIDVQCSLQSDDMVWLLQQIRELSGESSELTAGAIDPMQMPPVPCEVVYEFEGTQLIWDGVLSRFDGMGMDRDTRTLPCRVTVPEPAKYRTDDSPGGTTSVVPPSLMSGMFVSVRIPITTSVDLLRVPVEAVRPGGRIWVVRDRSLHVRRASVARSDDTWALIRAAETDLDDSDEVVVSPMVTIQDGMSVRQGESK